MGYLVGFIVAAALVGYLSGRGNDRRFLSVDRARCSSGALIIYAIGVPVLMNDPGRRTWRPALEYGPLPLRHHRHAEGPRCGRAAAAGVEARREGQAAADAASTSAPTTRGCEAKKVLVAALTERGHEVVDHGPHEYDALDDYPPFCLATGAGVVADPGSLGIVLGGSGNGEQIAANKVDGVRAALVWSEEIARLAREHNDANVISIGARMHTRGRGAVASSRSFLATPFSGDERHVRRIGQLAEYERTGELPPTR